MEWALTGLISSPVFVIQWIGRFRWKNSREEEEEEEEEEEDEEANGQVQPYHAGYIYVTDLGDDSVKQYRYL